MTSFSELRRIFLFDGVSDDRLRELLAAGEDVPFGPGDVLFRKAEPADNWWVLLEGRIDLLHRSGHDESVFATMGTPGQWAGGFLAWSDTPGYLATGRGAEAGRVLRVPCHALRSLAQSWFPFGVHLLEGFFQTVRDLEAQTRQHGALVALGTLAAGLAHEINNPAAAAARAVDALEETCDSLVASLAGLAQGSLSPEQFVRLDALRREIEPVSDGGSLAEADREAELLDWLDDRDVPEAWRLAPTLAAGGADRAWCERVAEVLDGATLASGLAWVAATVASGVLLSEIKTSTSRVSSLVAAVRSYSQLDRAPLQSVDVTEGIDSTLTMLGHKIDAGVEVVRDYAPDLPVVEAMPGELNQVWTNLIDNALDAIDGSGTLRLSAHPDGDHVVVEVADTGPGMPAAVSERAFEPFFTTKDVGKGTGLGLDISRRIIVERHHGDVEIDSRPGATVLRVRLPLVNPSSAGPVAGAGDDGRDRP